MKLFRLYDVLCTRKDDGLGCYIASSLWPLGQLLLDLEKAEQTRSILGSEVFKPRSLDGHSFTAPQREAFGLCQSRFRRRPWWLHARSPSVGFFLFCRPGSDLLAYSTQPTPSQASPEVAAARFGPMEPRISAASICWGLAHRRF